MTFAKRFLLGSAAAMTMVGAAQAADLPLAEPVEYVKVCNTYGEGFFYIPGSDTCLQIAGYARFQGYGFDIGGGNYESVFLAQTNIGFDARTETEYGTLRSYVRLEFTRTGGIGDGGNPNTDSKLIEHAFVQFAGLTAGHTTSFFDFYANANVFTTVAGSDRETNLLAYTATFGSGFSATIAIEDATERRWTGGGFNGSSTFVDRFGNVFDNTYARQTVPDIVGNLRVEQGWGAAQLSGALHRDNVPGASDKWGYAVQAGVKFNLDSVAAGDTIFLQAAYADGAIGYLQAGYGFDGFGYKASSGFEFGPASDFGPGGDKTDGYVLAGEFLHYWSPSLRSVFAGSWADISVGRGAGVDFTEVVTTASLVWSPVKKLDIGVEAGYSRLKFDDRVRFDNRTTAKQLDNFSSVLRVQRNF